MKGSARLPDFAPGQLFMVSLSGVPGVGKSSAIRRLRELGVLERLLAAQGAAIKVVYVLEPSDEWKRLGYLDLFYGDPDKNALAFQILVYKTHKSAVKRALREAAAKWPGERIFCVTERSVFDQMLFWRLQCDLKRESAGTLDDAAYKAVWEDWSETLWDLNHIFFCKTTQLSVTMERLKRRELFGSSLDGSLDLSSIEAADEIQVADGVPLPYQRALYAKHEDYFAQGAAHPPHAPPEGIPCTHLLFDAHYPHDEDALYELGKALLKPLLEKGEVAEVGVEFK